MTYLFQALGDLEKSPPEGIEMLFKVYFFTGGVSLFLTFGLFMLYVCKKTLRIHPNGIIMHLLCTLSVQSLCIFLTGCAFLIKQDKERVYGESFGFLTSCVSESLIKMFFTLSFLMWNFVWLYDLVKAFKNPMHTTDKHMWIYGGIVYLLAGIPSIVYGFYFGFGDNPYSIGPCYTCSINKSIYMYTIPIIEIIYVILACYVFFRYGRGRMINRFKRSGSKLAFFFRIQKWYLITFTIVWGMRIMMYFPSEDIKMVYAILLSVNPILLITPWLVQLFASLCRKRKKLMIAGKECPGKDESQIIQSLRNEIVEYLIKGIGKSISLVVGLKARSFEVEEENEFSSKLLQCCCGCCLEENAELGPTSSLLSMAGDQTMSQRLNLRDKATIHREAKTELTLLYNKESEEYVVEGNDSEEEFEGVQFLSLSPTIFHQLRMQHNVNEDDILSTFSLEKFHQDKLKVKLQSGKGGAFFVIPTEGNFMIKSINEDEFDVMTNILADYYIHYLKHPTSCITPIFGCYALYLSNSNDIKPQYFLLMKNVLDIDLKSLPDQTELYCFDLKGSSAGRKVLPNPGAILEGNIDPVLQQKTLKDEDFYKSYGLDVQNHLKITPIQGDKILKDLERDAYFFNKYKLIDYSLLLFVINVPTQIGAVGANLEAEKAKDDRRDPFSTTGMKRIGSSQHTSSDRSSAPVRLSKLTIVDSILEKPVEEVKEKVQLVIRNESEDVSQHTVLQPDIPFHSIPIEEKKEDPLPESAGSPVKLYSDACSKGVDLHPQVSQLVYDYNRKRWYQRSLKFGIIDYHTVYTFRKRIERFCKGCCQKNPSVAAPKEYARRFMSSMNRIFGHNNS